MNEWEVAAAKSVSFATVLCEVADVGSIQANPFRKADQGKNIRQNCSAFAGKLKKAVQVLTGVCVDIDDLLDCAHAKEHGLCEKGEFVKVFRGQCAKTCGYCN